MSSEGKPPTPGAGGAKEHASSPALDEVDSAWNDDEDLDDDATMVGKVPDDLVALSRRGTELEKAPIEEPEKHEAITARPPPMEPSVVVTEAPGPAVMDDEDDDEDEEDEPELAADDLDGGWDIEEKAAAEADVAAGLDAEARRKAAEARAAARKEKSRAKRIAAKERRKARVESVRMKQKKPRKRSLPPPRAARMGAAAQARDGAPTSSEPPASRTHATIPPAKPSGPGAMASAGARRDWLRMVLLVALVVIAGAFVIGLARR